MLAITLPYTVGTVGDIMPVGTYGPLKWLVKGIAMPQYIVTLSEAENKALGSVTLSQQEWIDNVVHERCRIAIDEIVNAEIQQKLETGASITGSKEDIVMAATVESASQKQERISKQTQLVDSV